MEVNGMKVENRAALIGFNIVILLNAMGILSSGAALAEPVTSREIPVLQPVYLAGLSFINHTKQYNITNPAEGIFVSPHGTPDGKGTQESPLDLETVLSGASGVGPGDVVWMMPGTYKGDFDSALAGADDAPILVRGWPGERVRIDGTLNIEGAHTWYWGFEVFPEDVDHRQSNGRKGVDLTHGYRCRLINVVVHNAPATGIGFHNSGREELSETYGCIIYDNGWQPEQEEDKYNRGYAHGWYIQNWRGEKFITDCISFNSWSYLLQVYASGSWVNGTRIEGNILFNPSRAIYDFEPGYIKAPITMGGNHYPAEGMTLIRQNYTYFPPDGGLKAAVFDMRLGYNSPNDTLICTDNFMVGGYGFEVGSWRSKLIERNTFYLRAEEPYNEKWTTPTEPSNHVFVLDVDRPDAPMFAFRPNKYEAGRGNLAIYNFNNADSVTVDLSNLQGLPRRGRTTPTAWLNEGDRYEVRSVLRLYGEPVAEGVYDGNPIVVDMRPLDDVPVGGNGKTLFQARPGFDAFVVLKNDWCMEGEE